MLQVLVSIYFVMCSKYVDQYFNRGRHNNLDLYFSAQSYFGLPKRTIRNNSNKIILFNQTLKDIEHIYRDVAGYDEFKELAENHGMKIITIFVLIDLLREIKEDIVFVIRAKTHI